jgi:carbonic anhydrase
LFQQYRKIMKRLDLVTNSFRSQPLDWGEACQLLLEGNRHFVAMSGRVLRESDEGQGDPKSPAVNTPVGKPFAQTPFAAVLGCADARVPPEIVFSKNSNELFVVRVAGNVLGQECLGSLRYAVKHFSETLKLVVVLAHANCGAVSEAVKAYLEPRRYLELATDYSMRRIEEHILIPVRVAALGLESLYGPTVTQQPGGRAALLEAAVALNGCWSAYCLEREFRERSHHPKVVFGVYDLISGHVRLPLSLPSQVSADESGLFPPPEDAKGIRQLALRICQGRIIQNLLKPAQRRSA